MSRSDPICGRCDTDLKERTECESFVTFYDLMGTRGDLTVECPTCKNLIEMEVSIITTY